MSLYNVRTTFSVTYILFYCTYFIRFILTKNNVYIWFFSFRKQMNCIRWDWAMGKNAKMMTYKRIVRTKVQ